MILEIIATSFEDAVVAEQAGASRLELCSALSEDGLTPSLGLIEAVVKGVDIPVYVIVRPHNRGFHYNDSDLAVMLADIQHIKRAGAAGIVIGALTKDHKVDIAAISVLIKEAGDMDITFHRAFDFVDNQSVALEKIAEFPKINRILTSGGKNPAPQSVKKLKKLVDQCQSKNIRIMAGNGMTPESLVSLVAETGIKEVHFGSGVRFKQSFMHPINPKVIVELKSMLKQFGK